MEIKEYDKLILKLTKENFQVNSHFRSLEDSYELCLARKTDLEKQIQEFRLELMQKDRDLGILEYRLDKRLCMSCGPDNMVDPDSDKTSQPENKSLQTS